jgi:hypothetical protein
VGLHAQEEGCAPRRLRWHRVSRFCSSAYSFSARKAIVSSVVLTERTWAFCAGLQKQRELSVDSSKYSTLTLSLCMLWVLIAR